MKQLASLLSVWSLCCCFQENLVQSLITKCTSVQMTVKWPNGTFKQCLYCEECHPGRGLYPHKCGDTVTFPVITHCKKCDSGKTFSDTYDTSSCKLCHSCAEHEIVTKNCTLSSDTKCNKTCNSGYFFSKPQQVCKRCSYCCLDGKHEEQPQCINQGLKAVNRYCSPRPDRTCTPLMVSTTTGSVISTEARSSTKHHKIEWILSCTGIGSLFGVILLYCLWRRSKRKIRGQDAQNLSNLDDGCNLRVACDPSEGNQGGLMQEEGPTLQEVQQNDGLIIASAASTARGIPRTGGCKDPVQLVNVPSENFTQRPDRTEEKKADESARVALLADNKDGEDDVSDNIDGKGAQGGHERRGSLCSGLQLLCRRLSPPYHMPYEPLPEKDPDQTTKGHSSKDVTIQLVTNGPKVPQAGSRVVFQCTVRECQQVFYRWYKDEQELQEENNSTLILDSVKVQDFGFYKCEVRSDKRYESNVVHLDVTPAEGKSYRNLSEVFDSDLGLKETVANLLEKETNVCRKAYKQVAFHYKMTNIDRLERCKNPGEDVLESLKSTQPDLTVYHFCKVLKGENIRRLDIVNKLVDYLIDRNGA